MTIAIVLLVYAIFIFTDFLPVLKSKKWLLIVPSAVFLCVALGVQLLYECNVHMPNPDLPISDFFNGLFNLK
jgi:hypothetical protein